MQIVFRLLLVLFIVEVITAGYLMGKRLLRRTPAIPQIQLVDPLILGEIQQLAEQADNGGSIEWQTLGEALLGQGFYPYAELAFRQSVALNHQNLRSQFNLAYCLSRTGRTTVGSQEFEKYIELSDLLDDKSPIKDYAKYKRGWNALREERELDAEKLFSQLPEFQPADYQAAKLMIRSGRAEGALSLIERNLINTPTALEFLSLYQRALVELGRDDEALLAADRMEHAKQEIQVDFETDFINQYHSQYGLNRIEENYNAVVRSQDYSKLTAQLDEFQSYVKDTRSPFYLNTLKSRAEIAFHNQQYDQLRTALDQLTGFGQHNADMLQLEGAWLEHQGKPDQAVQLWIRAANMDPNIILHLKIAEKYRLKDNQQQEQFHLAQSKLLEAIMAFRTRNYQQSRTSAELATEFDPSNAQAWFYLGESYRLLKLTAQAKSAYQQCLESNPYYGRAIRNLDLLDLQK